jgi:DHA1 family bicyclomycin/chloramphenicol resistance-like MFS transporter
VHFTLGLAGGQLLYGPYSDLVGRRKSLLIGLLVALAGSLICIVSKNILLIIAGRFLQGLGSSSCLSLSRAIMRDCFHGKEMAKVNSYISAL